eukprot:306154_1
MGSCLQQSSLVYEWWLHERCSIEHGLICHHLCMYYYCIEIDILCENYCEIEQNRHSQMHSTSKHPSAHNENMSVLSLAAANVQEYSISFEALLQNKTKAAWYWGPEYEKHEVQRKPIQEHWREA